MLRLPAWPQRIRLLRRAAAVIAVLAIVVDAVALFAADGPGWGLGALLVSLAGVVVAWRWPWPGLALTLVGCLGAAALGWELTGLWTVVVYTLFSAVLAGVPAVVAGGGVAIILYTTIALLADSGFSDPEAARQRSPRSPQPPWRAPACTVALLDGVGAARGRRHHRPAA